MDDELEDTILYQTWLSHMKLISRLAVGIPTAGFNPFSGHVGRTVKAWCFKPEVLIISLFVIAIFAYLQTLDVWSRTFLRQIQHALGNGTLKVKKLKFISRNPRSKLDWEFKEGYAAAYAVQGHRAHMEDRFVINDNINNTGVSLFAVFDGHGGDFAANYARDKLISSLSKQIIELKDIISGNATSNHGQKIDEKDNQEPASLQRKNSSKATKEAQDAHIKSTQVTDPELLDKIASISSKFISREVMPLPKEKSIKVDVTTYLDGKKINYSKLITDQVLATDKLLTNAAKKNMNVAGTTALMALLEGDKLIVANVGDSRGVMCDSKGNAIPLSFDHKPHQQREKMRINKAGGSVIFNGVWRVAGVLATSRALGDYPLKDRKLVIADPDILTFDLKDHDPMFILLASDGLWDTFSNEEAVAFIKERIDEPNFGAKALTLQSFYRGSLDNITVVVINMRKRNSKS